MYRKKKFNESRIKKKKKRKNQPKGSKSKDKIITLKLFGMEN